ncbi:MAG TPA: MFS transporter [Candidatus Hydrogenedentes bacterium]|nr:MFS transporter [Candidatus Hydrogenedentota bacterium]
MNQTGNTPQPDGMRQQTSFTAYLMGSALVAALGGLLFGFDTAVISGAEQRLQELFQPMSGMGGGARAFWHGFLVAGALIGTIVGAVAVGKPADIFGRRATMFGLAALYFVSAVGSAFAWDWYSFVIFRFIGGLGVGGASVVSPMYIAEISPAPVRGRLVALAQFNIVLGILIAFLSNYIIGLLQLGDVEWRWMFGVEAFPAAVYFLLLFMTPRSPRWLLAMKRENEARAVLTRVGSRNVETEIKAIKESLDIERHNLQEPFFQKKYMTPILLAIMIAAFNQLSGINAILYYSKRIFESAGFGASASLLNSVGLGAVNLIFTMAALTVIDRFGRKKLMIVGSIGYILSLGATALAFYTQSHLVQGDGGAFVREISQTGGWVVFISLLVFIASHAFGQGAVIWVFISEVFPTRVRARGQALGSFTHWIFAAAISQTFPLIAEVSGGHIFAFYCVCMVGQLLWVLFYMPETKGISLEEIQKRLHIE